MSLAHRKKVLERGLWHASILSGMLDWVIGHDIILLKVTVAVVVYRERGSDEVLAKKIGWHSPPLNHGV